MSTRSLSANVSTKFCSECQYWISKMPRVWVVEYKSMWGLRVRVIMPTHCTSVEEFWVSFKIYPQVKYFQQVAWSGLKYSRIWQFFIAIYKKKALFLLLSLDFIFPTFFCKMSFIGIKNLFRFDTVINHHSSKFVRVILKIETLISCIESKDWNISPIFAFRLLMGH